MAGVDEKIYQGVYQFNEISPAWFPQVVLVNESGLFDKHGVILRIQPDGTSTLVETVNAAAEADLIQVVRLLVEDGRGGVFVLVGPASNSHASWHEYRVGSASAKEKLTDFCFGQAG